MTRMTLTKQKKINAPAESPAELQQYIDAKVRTSSAEKWSMWTLPDYSVTDPVTIVPFSCDYMINSTAEFIKEAISQSNTGDTRVLSLCGDATHDETAQKLKKLRFGFAGCHWNKEEWCATMMPSLDCACNDESVEAIDVSESTGAYLGSAT